MQKPNNFDNTQSFGDYTPLEKGGHVCIIKQVTEQKSTSGRDMIVIVLDTDKTDKQPNYYSEKFAANTRENKKWPNNAIIRQLVLDADGNCNKGFKTFIDMVEKSNNGFKVVWGDKFADCFKNKLVGVQFGGEEYEYNGSYHIAVKAQNFRTVEDVRAGKVEVPKDKLLNKDSSTGYGDPDMTPVSDSDMPF